MSQDGGGRTQERVTGPRFANEVCDQKLKGRSLPLEEAANQRHLPLILAPYSPSSSADSQSPDSRAADD